MKLLFGVTMLAFLLVLNIPNVDAETLNLISNTDKCIYDPETNTDYCKTEYELCEPGLNQNKIEFEFVDFTKNGPEWKGTIEGLDTEMKIKHIIGNCYKVEIEGTKYPILDTDNALCYDGNCHYEFAPWNGSYNFRNALYGNVSALSGNTIGLIPINITLDDGITKSHELFWLELEVSNTNQTIGYVYWNDYTDYIGVDKDESTAVVTIIDEGNGTNHGTPEPSLVAMWPLGDLIDRSIYGNNGTVVDDATKVSGCGIGSCYDFDGSTGGISVPSFSPIISAYTFSALLNVDSLASSRRWLSHHEGGVSQNGDFIFELRSTGSMFDMIAEMVWKPQRTGDDITVGEWVHMYVTWNKSLNGGLPRIYINCTESGYTAGASWTGDILPAVSDWYIGSIGSGAYSMDGKIDNLMSWNKSLSNDERLLNCYSQRDFFEYGTAETPPPPPPPIHSYMIFELVRTDIPFFGNYIESLTFKAIIFLIDRLTIIGNADIGGNLEVMGCIKYNQSGTEITVGDCL